MPGTSEDVLARIPEHHMCLLGRSLLLEFESIIRNSPWCISFSETALCHCEIFQILNLSMKNLLNRKKKMADIYTKAVPPFKTCFNSVETEQHV